MNTFKVLFFSILAAMTFLLVGCGGASSSATDSPSVQVARIILPVTTKEVTTNSQAFDIVVNVIDDKGAPYSTGKVVIDYPDDYDKGRGDIGSFAPSTGSITNGEATFSYTAPSDLDANTSDITFGFHHDSNPGEIVRYTITINDIYDVLPVYVPTLVVVMNWTNYSETDPLIWYNKFFDKTQNSVNRWFDETTGGKLVLVPVTESSGTANDGLIMVSMGKLHPGDYNNTTFRDTEIYNAITKKAVVDSMDFAALDTDGDGYLNKKELQIVFIVAGGESSYRDAVDHSIWAHAWAFDSSSPWTTLKLDNKEVMRYTGIEATSGSYARFGATHGIDDTVNGHKATIGVIAHELGHSLLSLGDYYDNGGGSGLGWYDIMSGGSWAMQSTDTYQGETPTQYSAYNRIDAGLDANVTDVNSSQDINITCSSRELIKLVTTKANEYFLIECRDTAKPNSDISFEYAESTFTNNKLFAMLYHVDTLKTGNTEYGTQTNSNHYKVALVEKDTTTLMTSTTSISANYADVYSSRDVVDATRTKLYDATATATGYGIEIINENYTDRTMTIRITK